MTEKVPVITYKQALSLVGKDNHALPLPYAVTITDDVVLTVTAVDDQGDFYLNGILIGTRHIPGFTPFAVSLKEGLNLGLNTLRIVVTDYSPGGQNYWGISYTLGIYEANGTPKYPLIDISYSIRRDGPRAVTYDVSYALNRV